MTRNKIQVFLALAMVVFLAPLAVTKTKAPPKEAPVTSAGLPSESKIESFLGDSKLDMKQVFKEIGRASCRDRV